MNIPKMLFHVNYYTRYTWQTPNSVISVCNSDEFIVLLVLIGSRAQNPGHEIELREEQGAS